MSQQSKKRANRKISPDQENVPPNIKKIRESLETPRIAKQCEQPCTFDVSSEDILNILQQPPASRIDAVNGLLLNIVPESFDRCLLKVFWWSCYLNEPTIVRWCLKKGVRSDLVVGINLPNETPWLGFSLKRWTPLELVVRRDLTAVLKVFIEERADEVYDYGDQLIRFAAFHSVDYKREVKIDCCEMLMKFYGTKDQIAALEIRGAAYVIRDHPAEGKKSWIKSLEAYQQANTHKARRTSDLMDKNMIEFRSFYEIKVMRAKELRLQALSVLSHYFEQDDPVFVEALMSRYYTKTLTLRTLEKLHQLDLITVNSLKQLEKFFRDSGCLKIGDQHVVSGCISLLFPIIEDMRHSLDTHPVCMADYQRFDQLAKFTARLLLSLETLEYKLSSEFMYTLSRIVGVFQPMAQDASMLHYLLEAHIQLTEPNQNSIFEILQNAGAELHVFDRNQQSLVDLALQLAHEGFKVSPETMDILDKAYLEANLASAYFR